MASMKPERELDLREILQYLWQHAAAIGICMLAGAVASLGLAQFKAGNELPYQASALLYFDTQQESQNTILDSGERFEFYTNITNLSSVVVKSEQLLQPVVENLGLDMDTAALANLVSVESVSSSSFMRLTVRGTEAEMTERICNEILALAPDASAAMTNLGTLQAASQAEVTAAAKPNLPKAAVVGALLGVILSVMLLVAMELFDHAIHDAEDVTYYLDMPTLGVIPAACRGKPTAAITEAYRSLGINVDSRLQDQVSRVVVVADTGQRDSGVQTAQELAKALARSGKRVLLVDADLRGGELSAQLGLVGQVGLVELLGKKGPINTALLPSEELECTVLPCGTLTGDSARVVSTSAVKELFEELRRQFDVIIVCAVDITGTTDAAILGRVADGVLLVLRVGKTSIESAMLAKEKMKFVKAPVWGAVLAGYSCKKARRRDGYYYAYSSKRG